jgi:UDP-glucose 4-epimerase
VPPAPTSDFGRVLLDVEDRLSLLAEARAVPLTTLRFAPLLGSHVPSPLGRLLKLAVVPFNALADPTFALVHTDDAAAIVLAALDRHHDGPINVVADGAVTASQAARIGGRVPMPTFGVGWTVAGIGTELVSAPLPSHVRELLVRGRVADGSRCASLLGVAPARTTRDVVTELYEQLNVIFLPVGGEEAAA